ncbi:hypothetical protein OG381_46850 [Streptomyces sp. NBC_00490]|uniref:nuclear transport factor 2 family protein n=1 Tax=Streptomyces sp. NBC_00490 TaxID=2903657 RepID=UPI002E186ED5
MSTITTPASTRSVVDAFFARFGEADMPALLDLFADGVAFHVGGTPNVSWAGNRTSKDDIAAFRSAGGIVAAGRRHGGTPRRREGGGGVLRRC